tara:strand:+ start:1194 stop:2249 length:1056 start_codon:yes stop_codon:yes gene_type:complete
MNKFIIQDVTQITEKIDVQRFSGKKILLTGAAGFLGSYFTHFFTNLNDLKILKDPCQLFCLDNFTRGTPDWLLYLNKRDDLKLIKSDIIGCRDFEKCDFVIHAASIASPTYYRKKPIETMDANVLGLRNLLDFFRQNKCESFLYFSTSEIYGDPDSKNIPTKETYRGFVSCTGPRACYDESKRFGETLAVNFFEQYNLPIKIARPFNNYGPGLKINDKRVLPDFFKNILEGKNIELFSDGKATRTFCYISDAVTGYLKILLSEFNGEPFNIGVDNPEISMNDLANKIVDLLNLPNKVIFKKNTDSHYLTDNPQRRCPDLEKSKKLLDYNPMISLDEGLIRMFEYYKSEFKK